MENKSRKTRNELKAEIAKLRAKNNKLKVVNSKLEIENRDLERKHADDHQTIQNLFTQLECYYKQLSKAIAADQQLHEEVLRLKRRINRDWLNRASEDLAYYQDSYNLISQLPMDTDGMKDNIVTSDSAFEKQEEQSSVSLPKPLDDFGTSISNKDSNCCHESLDDANLQSLQDQLQREMPKFEEFDAHLRFSDDDFGKDENK